METQTLEVVAKSSTNFRADVGIDSFFLGGPGTNPNNPNNPPGNPPTPGVPVPGSLLLMGLGLTGFALRRKKA